MISANKNVEILDLPSYGVSGIQIKNKISRYFEKDDHFDIYEETY